FGRSGSSWILSTAQRQCSTGCNALLPALAGSAPPNLVADASSFSGRNQATLLDKIGKLAVSRRPTGAGQRNVLARVHATGESTRPRVEGNVDHLAMPV